MVIDGESVTIEDKSCSNYSHLIRCSTGFSYAGFQHKIIGSDPIVLINAYRDRRNLEFSVPWEWIEENHLPGRYGLTQDDGMVIYEHIKSCPSEECKEAFEVYLSVSKLLTNDNSPIEGVMVAAQFNPKNGSQKLVLNRRNGWAKSIDALKPVFRLFRDNKDDFVWPGEGQIRLEGYVKVSFDPDTEGVTFSRHRGGSFTVPYDSIRKVRAGDRDIWRAPDLYHINLSHPNEERFDGYGGLGSIILELREDRDDAEVLAEKISSEAEMKRV